MPAPDEETRLLHVVSGYGRTAVGFSGGVDSTLVAAAAFRALGDDAVAVTNDSPTLPRSELVAARRLAGRIGIRFETIDRNELDDPGFAQNPTNRCYFCKDGLADALATYAKQHGYGTIALGVNKSDQTDWRPGIQAASNRGARFPLVEAGMHKDAVRTLARRWGLPVWDKPASPCLSSRIPYGQMVTIDKLARIEHAEEAVRAMGFGDLRVRHVGTMARVEVPQNDVARLEALRDRLDTELTRLGFEGVELDTRGLVSGRLNLDPGIRTHQ